MMEAQDRYQRAGQWWFWICAGLLLAFNSFGSYGSGLSVLLFGPFILFYALRRLYRAFRAEKADLQDFAVAICAVMVVVVGEFGRGSFTQKHETNFAPLLAALEQYQNTTGQYPDELAELMPEYMDSLPECPVSGGWASDSPRYGKREMSERWEESYRITCTVGAFLFPQYGIYDSERPGWWYQD